MLRMKNCLVFGWMSKGEGKKFYFAKESFKQYTDDREKATRMPYDQAWSVAKAHGLYVETA